MTQPLFSPVQFHQLDFCSRQICVGRNQVQSLHIGVHDCLPRIELRINQQVIYGIFQIFLRYTDAAGRISLGIDVQHQYFLSELRQTRSEIDIRCGLSDAALLVKNCYCSTQIKPPVSESDWT